MMIWKGWWNLFPKLNFFPLNWYKHLFSKANLLSLIALFLYHFSTAQTAFDSVVVEKKEKMRFTVDSTRTTLKLDSAVSNADSTSADKKKKGKRHSPTKAALLSAALPGLGQGYNKKYWKIPIVYAGFAGLGYAVYYTASEFKNYRNAYRLQVDGDKTTIGSYKGIQDEATLKTYRDYFKKNLDISAICTAVWYTLNIVDAAVDAHLFEWNMKDDLTVSWRPVLMNPTGNNSACLGVGIQLRM